MWMTEQQHGAIFSVKLTGHSLPSTKQQPSQVTSWVSSTDVRKLKDSDY